MVASNPFSKALPSTPTQVGGSFPISPHVLRPTGGAPRRDMTPYRYAIRSIESAGSGDYRAIGPVTDDGARAIGMYQVMDYNVGPWTKKHLGFEMTPEQFLASETAQELVFEREFGSYLDKYGDPAAAAQAWFGGEGSVGKTDRTDGYITVGQYADEFNAALSEGAKSGYTMMPSGGRSGSGGGSVISETTSKTAHDIAAQIKGVQVPTINQPPEGARVGIPSIDMSGPPQVASAEDLFDPETFSEQLSKSRMRSQQRKQGRTLPQVERRSQPRNGKERQTA